MKAYNTYLLLCFIFFASCNLLGSGGNNDGGDKKEPDITRPIVFAAIDSIETGQIFAMKADGSELKQLTHFDGTGSSEHPTWSPDGEQIIFSSSKQSTTRGLALWIIEADGSNPRALMYNGFPLLGDNADWSPDGKKIVFDFCTECEISTRDDIYTYNFETDQMIRLTDESHGGPNTFPRWSPNGKKILFNSKRDYENADTLRFRSELYIMNSDGSNQTRLTQSGIEIPAFQTWLNSEEILYQNVDLETEKKNLYILNTETGDKELFLENLDGRDLQWFFWDKENNQFKVISKYFDELPVVISTYDVNGNLLDQHLLNHSMLKTALGFDWIFTSG